MDMGRRFFHMAKKIDKRDEQIAELIFDLQRVRADFENYRKRVELEKQQAAERGEAKTALKLLPVIDTIERAIDHIPADIATHQWVQGVTGLIKQLDKALDDMGITRIPAEPGTPFDPSVHQAIQMNEDAEGDHEIVESQLQTGYALRGQPIRLAMVKVTRQ